MVKLVPRTGPWADNLMKEEDFLEITPDKAESPKDIHTSVETVK